MTALDDPRNAPSWWQRCIGGAEVYWSQRLFPAPAPLVRDHGQHFWRYVLTLLILAASFFLPNRSFPLLEPDEGRRAEISREILVNNNWIACTLNQQPYYDKPPLFHWLVALSFWCFGASETSARLVPALATTLTILTTFVLGRRLLGNRAAFLGALALMLMGGYALVGRLVGLDGTLTLLINASLLTAHEAVHTGPLRWRWWLASALLCGLGVLTKGPIALILTLPPVLLHARLSQGAARPRLVHLMAFAGMVGLVVLPWVALVLAYDPHMLYAFLFEHNLRRFTGGVAHEQAWWFYLPVLGAACLPWSPIFPFFLHHLGRTDPALLPGRYRPLGFLLIWGCWCVLFFTLSRGKLPLYVLPSLPAFALLTGWFLEQLLAPVAGVQRSQGAWTFAPRLTILLVGTAWTALTYAGWIYGLASAGSAWMVGLLTVVAIAVCLVPKWRMTAWAGWGLCMAFVLAMNIDLSHRLLPALARQRAPLAATRELRQLAKSGQIAVACPGQKWPTITFACRAAIFDSDTATESQLLAFLENHPQALVIVSKPAFIRLKQQASAAFGFTVLQTSEFGHVVLAQHGMFPKCAEWSGRK